MVASRRTKRRRRPDRPAIPLVLYGAPPARLSRCLLDATLCCARAVVAAGLAVVLGGAALVGASFLESAIGPAALVVSAAAVLAGALVLRSLEGCSAWVAAALVCASAAPTGSISTRWRRSTAPRGLWPAGFGVGVSRSHSLFSRPVSAAPEEDTWPLRPGVVGRGTG